MTTDLMFSSIASFVNRPKQSDLYFILFSLVFQLFKFSFFHKFLCVTEETNLY